MDLRHSYLLFIMKEALKECRCTQFGGLHQTGSGAVTVIHDDEKKQFYLVSIRRIESTVEVSPSGVVTGEEPLKYSDFEREVGDGV